MLNLKKTVWFFVLFSQLLLGCVLDNGNSSAINKAPIQNNGRYHRILAATPAMEEIVLGLVEPEQVVAVSNYSRKSEFPEIAEKAKKVQGVISDKPSTESIIAQKPDIVFLPVVFGRTQADTLKECGLHVVPLDVTESLHLGQRRVFA